MKHALQIIAILLCGIAFAEPAHGQGPKWELKYETEIRAMQMSPSGEYVLYIREKDDNDVLECLSTTDGKLVWSKALVEPGPRPLLDFVDSNRIIVGHDNKFDFISVKDGVVRNSLQTVSESWSDLTYQPIKDPDFEQLRPFASDSVGIFFFSDGMQIIDLLNPKIIYQTECSPSKVRYKYWDKMMLIDMHNSCDSIYFVDLKNRKLAFKAAKDDQEISESAYQNFVSTEDELLLFNDDNMTSVNLATGKINATLAVDPDEPDVFLPVFSEDKKQMLLWVSQDDVQKLYEPKSGKVRWQTKPGEMKGIVGDVTLLENKEGIVYSYDEEGVTTLYKIDTETGAILWKQRLFKQDDVYVPGHVKPSSTLKTIATVAAVVAVNVAANAAGGGRGGGIWVPRELFSYSSDGSYASTNRDKATEGYVKTIDHKDGKLNLVTVGKIYSELKSGERDEYDGEMLMTIDLKDGKIIKSTPVDVLKNSEASDFNAFRQFKLVDHDEAKVIVGESDVYIKMGENLDHYGFPMSKILFLDSGDKDIYIRVDSLDEEQYDFWKIDVGSHPSKRSLVARTFARNLVGTGDWNYTGTLRITDEDISLHPLVTDAVTAKSFSNPTWRYTVDDLDIGDMPDDKWRWSQGISGLENGNIAVCGSDAISVIADNGKCKTRYEWSPAIYTTYPPRQCGRGIVYATGDDTSVLPNNCDNKAIARLEIDQSDTRILLAEKQQHAVVADVDEGIIVCYDLR